MNSFEYVDGIDTVFLSLVYHASSLTLFHAYSRQLYLSIIPGRLIQIIFNQLLNL